MTSHPLPIATNAQRVESKIKVASLRKTNNRRELTTAHIHNVRSQLVRDMSEATKCDQQHKNRQKKSYDDDTNFLPGKHFNKNMICGCESYFNYQHRTEEFCHCRRLINANNCYKRRRVDEDVLSFIAAGDKCQRSKNAAPEKRSTTWVPLLVGKVPFGCPSKKMIPLHQRELVKRSVASFDETEHIGTSKLIKMMREDEHPQLVLKKDDDLKEEEKRELRYFHPSFLNAEDWSDDVADDALKIIY